MKKRRYSVSEYVFYDRLTRTAVSYQFNFALLLVIFFELCHVTHFLFSMRFWESNEELVQYMKFEVLKKRLAIGAGQAE